MVFWRCDELDTKLISRSSSHLQKTIIFENGLFLILYLIHNSRDLFIQPRTFTSWGHISFAPFDSLEQTTGLWSLTSFKSQLKTFITNSESNYFTRWFLLCFSPHRGAYIWCKFCHSLCIQRYVKAFISTIVLFVSLYALYSFRDSF